MNKTAEQIANETDEKDGLANIRAINKIYRSQDESDLWPVKGRFNVTERAIRRVQRFARSNGAIYGLEYCLAIENEMSDIVNSIG